MVHSIVYCVRCFHLQLLSMIMLNATTQQQCSTEQCMQVNVNNCNTNFSSVMVLFFTSRSSWSSVSFTIICSIIACITHSIYQIVQLQLLTWLNVFHCSKYVIISHKCRPLGELFSSAFLHNSTEFIGNKLCVWWHNMPPSLQVDNIFTFIRQVAPFPAC